MPEPLVPDYPVGATARRPGWTALPDWLRALVERRCGAPVTRSVSAPSGFTAGFAARLELADGAGVFVKAAAETDDAFANHAVEGYREEARKLALLPTDVPAPRLRWVEDTRGWCVLCIDAVAGRPPHRPWWPTELELALDAQQRAAAALTPAPNEIAAGRFVTEFAGEADHWTRLGADPVVGAHAEVAAQLCVAGLAGSDGDSLVHADLRDDNIIIVADDDTAWICDWNWPMLAAPWFDTVTLLISAHGDGIDTDRILARRTLTRGVDPDAIDGLLALLVGYWQVRQHHPVPASSPWIRRHQRWYGAVAWRWLGERRRWR